MKTYISGKISGLPEHEARAKFDNTAILLKAKGYIPVNPFDVQPLPPVQTAHALSLPAAPAWEDYMAADIRALMDCQAIYMQRDWGQSKGARIEYQIALELGLVVMFEGQFN
jgi:hypothetical protein